MKISVELSDEELDQLEVLGTSVDDFLQPHFNAFFRNVEANFELRTHTAITGAMRWEWSQECAIRARTTFIGG